MVLGIDSSHLTSNMTHMGKQCDPKSFKTRQSGKTSMNSASRIQLLSRRTSLHTLYGMLHAPRSIQSNQTKPHHSTYPSRSSQPSPKSNRQDICKTQNPPGHPTTTLLTYLACDETRSPAAIFIIIISIVTCNNTHYPQYPLSPYILPLRN